MNHPDFRLGGKIFASLGYPSDEFGMVRLTPQQQQTFMLDAPRAFHLCAGAWGRQGATSVHLASVDKKRLAAALDAAGKNVGAKLGTKRVSKRPKQG